MTTFRSVVLLLFSLLFGLTGCKNTLILEDGGFPAPDISPESGQFFGGTTVTITSYNFLPGAEIYYTDDGTTPDNTDTLFVEEDFIWIERATVIKAVEYYQGKYSQVATAWYEPEISEYSLKPDFSPEYGMFEESVSVEITSLEGARIYYTTDGSSPNDSSTPYDGPVEITETSYLKAIAYLGDLVSEVRSVEFVITPLSAAASIDRFFWGTWKCAGLDDLEIDGETVVRDGDNYFYSGSSWSTSSELKISLGKLVKQSENMVLFESNTTDLPLEYYRAEGYDGSFSFRLIDSSSGGGPVPDVDMELTNKSSYMDVQSLTSDSSGTAEARNIMVGASYELKVPSQPGIASELTFNVEPFFSGQNMGDIDLSQDGPVIQMSIAPTDENYDGFAADGATGYELYLTLDNTGSDELALSTVEITAVSPDLTVTPDESSLNLISNIFSGEQGGGTFTVTCDDISGNMEIKKLEATISDYAGTYSRTVVLDIPFYKNIDRQFYLSLILQSYSEHVPLLIDPLGNIRPFGIQDFISGTWKLILRNMENTGDKYGIHFYDVYDNIPVEFSLTDDIPWSAGEPNNSFDESQELSFGETLFGYLGVEDADYFEFEVTDSNTLVYHDNGCDTGSVPVDSGYRDYGETVTLPGNSGSLVRDGFIFTGWGLSSGEEPSWEPVTPVTELNTGFGVNDIYAVWQPKVVKIAGEYILRADGTVWDQGDLGDPEEPAEPFMTGISDICASDIYYGGNSTFFALEDGGSLWAWGNNSMGQTGVGYIGSFGGDPVKVMENAAEVSVYGMTTLVLDTSGVLWGVGRNTGQLANITEGEYFTDFRQLTDGVSSFSMGYDFIAVIKTDGSLWTSGRNTFGQLGRSGQDDWSGFAQIAPDAESVSAGRHHLIYLDSSGNMWATGYNRYGQLGTGTIDDVFSPVQVYSGGVRIRAGEYASFLITDAGNLMGAGDNNFGLLGLGAVEYQSSMTLLKTGVTEVFPENYSTFAVDGSGSLWITGFYDDDYSELPDMTIFQQVPDVSGTLSVSSYSVGIYEAYQRFNYMVSGEDGSVWRWLRYAGELTPDSLLDMGAY